jgi:uncharacterized membrane protein YgcG
VRFTIRKSIGEMYVLSKHNEAPIKVLPPYLFMSADQTEITVDVCNMDEGKQYLGFFGSTACAAYDITAAPFEGECHEIEQHDTLSGSHGMVELHRSHFEYAACEPGGWVDFFYHVTEEELGNNLNFELVSSGSSLSNPTALNVHLFTAAIPEERFSEDRSVQATDGTYSITINSERLTQEGDYYLCVQCAATKAVRFKVVTFVVERALHLAPIAAVAGSSTHGEVCPGNWLYHSTFINGTSGGGTEVGQGMDVTLTVHKSIGELILVPRRDRAPVRLGFPMRLMGADERAVTVRLCDVSHQNVYIGVRGGLLGGSSDACAVYGVSVEWSPHNTTCVEHSGSRCDAVLGMPPNFFSGVPDAEKLHLANDTRCGVLDETGQHFVELHNAVSEFVTCDPNGWHDFKFLVPAAQKSVSNMMFRLTDLSGAENPHALSLHVWPGSMPPADRSSDAKLTVETASAKSYSVAFNLVELKYWNARLNTEDLIFYASVKCQTSERTRFQMTASLVSAEQHLHVRTTDEVCPMEWSYHFYDAHEGQTEDAATDAGHVEDASDGHRRVMQNQGGAAEERAGVAEEELEEGPIRSSSKQRFLKKRRLQGKQHSSRPKQHSTTAVGASVGAPAAGTSKPQEGRRLVKKGGSSGSSGGGSSGGGDVSGSSGGGDAVVGGYGDLYQTGHHLRAEIELYSGDIRMLALAEGHHPEFTSENVFSRLFPASAGKSRSKYDILRAEAVACDMNRSASYYIGVYGGSECAEYSLVMTEFEGPCEEYSILHTGTESAMSRRRARRRALQEESSGGSWWSWLTGPS